MQTVIDGSKCLAAEAGKPTWDWSADEDNAELKAAIKARFEAPLAEAYTITEKMARYQKVGELKDACVAEFATDAEGAPQAGEVKELFAKIEKSVVREGILSGKPRIDGRALDAVRSIDPATMRLRASALLLDPDRVIRVWALRNLPPESNSRAAELLPDALAPVGRARTRGRSESAATAASGPAATGNAPLRAIAAASKPSPAGAGAPSRSRVNPAPNKSSVERPSSSQAWGAREPGRAVGV